MDIGKSIKHQRVSNAVAAGTSDINTTVVDRQGFAGVKWTVAWGAISATAVTRCKVQQGTLSDGSDMADLEGSLTSTLTPTTDDNKITVVDLYTCTERYVRLVIDRGTANAVVDSAVAELYGAAIEPVTQDATTVDELKTLIGPAEGTA